MNLRTQLFTRSKYYNGGKPNFTPIRVVIHETAAGNNRLNRYVPDYNKFPTCGNAHDNHWDNDKALGVHAWVGIDFDGKTIATVQALPWDCKGAHAGSEKNGSANATAIGIEICDAPKDIEYTKKAYREAVEVVAMLCKSYGWYPLDSNRVMGHYEAYEKRIGTNSGDPKSYFATIGKTMDTFRNDVNNILIGKDDEKEENPVDYEQWKKYAKKYEEELREQSPETWSEEMRQWAEDHGFVIGDKEDRMAWMRTLTLQELVTILYRLEVDNKSFM